jgi:hypothetical protein
MTRTSSQAPVDKLTGATELFQLSRADFEVIMEQFPIVRKRLAESGQIKQRLRSVHEVQRLKGGDDEVGQASPTPSDAPIPQPLQPCGALLDAACNVSVMSRPIRRALLFRVGFRSDCNLAAGDCNREIAGWIARVSYARLLLRG